MASTYEKTNSFIPNLVWLPKQIAKLTDREDSFAQNLLKTISYKIYCKDETSDFNRGIWKELSNPQSYTITSFNIEELNYFKVSQEWIDKKKSGLIVEIEKIKQVLLIGYISEKKVKCSSYLPTLKENITEGNKQKLIDWLDENLKILNSRKI